MKARVVIKMKHLRSKVDCKEDTGKFLTFAHITPPTSHLLWVVLQKVIALGNIRCMKTRNSESKTPWISQPILKLPWI